MQNQATDFRVFLRYHYQPNLAGWTPKQLTGLSHGTGDKPANTCTNSGFKAGAFGGVALFAVIFYASGIPRVQDDILKKIPGLSAFYDRSVPASDNPF
ncbi:hypothetical protein TruAng_004628 [Truncatella angustata]|nr:hypothetical protein TruAng_004628 [Truncatella angustata]